MNIGRLYADVVGELEKKADAEGIEKEMYYHKTVGDRFKCYGISAAEFAETAKKFRQAFRDLSFEERIELARRFFRSRYGEQMSFGIALLKLSVKQMKPEDLRILEEFSDCLNNWGTVDAFCIEVLQPLLLAHSEELLKILRKWNRSESLWKRRASVIVFTRKVGTSGRFTDEALELCDNLVWDKEDLVRKGAGWALKDCMRGDRTKVLEYVKELRRKGASAVITLYAIRDLKGKERREVLNIRPQA